jgi:hypothetical protein
LLHEMTSFLNMSNLGGRGGGGTSRPPPGAMARGKEEIRRTSECAHAA